MALLIVLGLMSLPLGAAEIQVPDEIIVKYKTLNRFADHGAVARRVNRHTEVVRVAGRLARAAGRSKWAEIQDQIAAIQQDPNVLYAEPNYLGHFAETVPPPPNDPSYTSQWWLPVIGDRTLWALGRGSGVVVAVIDTGVDLTHPDLMPNLLSNGKNYGDDPINGNASPQDLLGHGTRVAGIIAAAQNNGLGVSGLAPAAKILPVKINAGAQGTFTSDVLASAITYAVSQGAKVINLSLTVDNQTQTVQDAVQAALNAGVAVVAAAGNTDVCGSAGPVQFPATMAGVIAVAATDATGGLANFSCRGPEVAVAAPGENVVSTLLGGQYGTGGPGTSFSAPIVSAALADVVSINPSLPASQFAAYLRSNAKAISGGTYAFGFLDAGATGNSLVPHLVLSKQQFSAQESLTINFALPPTGAAMNIYVAVQTPLGEYALHPDGSWTAVTSSGYVPLALGYRSSAALTGTLFGSGGIFGAIPLSSLPAGAYTWRTALVNSVSASVVGDAIITPMTLQ
ncbi:MAG: S8 family peptidase [Burkholderiales bacterium]